MSFGAMVRAERERRGWTQDGLGEQVGLDRTSVSAIEHDRKRVSLPALRRLVDVLGLDAHQALLAADETAAEAPSEAAA